MRKTHVRRAPLLLGSALLLAPITPALAQPAPLTSSESAKKIQDAANEKLRYIGQLISLDESQIALGRIALERSQNLQIRELAQNMIDSHSQHLSQVGNWARARAQELRTAAGLQPELGVGGAGAAGASGSTTAPPEGGLAGIAGTMEAFAQRAQQHRPILSGNLAPLMKESGNSFDKDWVDAVRDSQSQASSLVRDGVDKYAEDAGFASLLASTEPLVQRDQRKLQALQPSLK
jgi:putative membrane protein